MENDDPIERYIVLREMFKSEEEHDQIMAHIEDSGITIEDSTYSSIRGYLLFHPLMLAVRYGRLDIINSLIGKGFDPHAKYEDYQGTRLYSLMHYASACLATTVIEVLVDQHHLDVNVIDSHGNTPVMMAIRADTDDHDSQLETVKCLVRKGADVAHTADLTAAVWLKLVEISKYLISCGGNLHATAPLQYSPLMWSACSRKVEIAKLLVEAGASIEGSEGRKLLLIAVAQNDLKMVEYCSSIGIDLDWEGEFLPAINIATECEALNVATYLVKDVNVSLERRGSDDKTAFEMAFIRTNTDFIELFLNAGYNPCNERCLNEDHVDKDLQDLTEKVLESVAGRTLQDYCVYQVRRSLGRSANQKVEQLPLPTQLKEIVKLNHVSRRVSKPSFPRVTLDRVDMILDEYDSFYANISKRNSI